MFSRKIDIHQRICCNRRYGIGYAFGIRWEHKVNIHTGWMRRGNHYISIGKNNFVAESTNKLNVHPIIKMKGKVTLNFICIFS